MKIDRIMLSLIFAFVLIVGAMIYFNTGSRVAVTGNVIEEGVRDLVAENQTIQEPEMELKKYIPLELADGDILVSFRIDDITFETKQKSVLENALYLARKYNITFDLAVIAKPFDEKADPEVFKIYEDNQDVFEVVAHGWDHTRYLGNNSYGEFSKAPPDYQENHIKKMKAVFEKHDITTATQIFLLPWSAGDENTIKLAEEQGYIFMTQTRIPNNDYKYVFKKIRVLNVFVSGIPMEETMSNETIEKAKEDFLENIKNGRTEIHVLTHPINYEDAWGMEELIRGIQNNSDSFKPKIKFGMIGDGVER